MNCWNILGIAQTSDLTAIKAAYAAKAKECHPEEHPEAFQQLQQAYRSASRYAKVQKNAAADRQNIARQKEVMENKAAAEAITKSSEKETALITEKSGPNREPTIITGKSGLNREPTVITENSDPDRENKVIVQKSKFDREPTVIIQESEPNRDTTIIDKVIVEKSKSSRENEVISDENELYREPTVITQESEPNRDNTIIAEESEPDKEPTVIVEQEKPVKQTSAGDNELKNTMFPEGKEDIGELSYEFDYKEIEESPQDFDYEVVEEADLKDQFFKEFFSIAWNPYLMNNLNCWEYMLKRAPYEQLLASQAFRNNFVRTVSYQLSGWQRKTILFFEKWLESYPARDQEEQQKKETEFFCWRCRRLGLFSKLVPIQRCVTNDQKQLHELFLSQVKRCGKDTSLSSAEDVECYLSYYLPYAIEKPEKIKQLYLGSGQGRSLMLGVLMTMTIIIGMVIYVQVRVVPQMDEKKEKEIEQQQIELRREFLEKNAERIGEYYDQFPDSEAIAEIIAEMEELGIGNLDDMTTAEE